MDNLTLNKPLTDREAGRVKTILEQKKIKFKLRLLVGLSPATIALFQNVQDLKLTAKDIAEAAGRDEEKA